MIVSKKCLDITCIFRLFCWIVACYCYFFQVPFRELAKFIVPMLFLFLVTYIPRLKIQYSKIYVIILSCYFVYLGIEIFVAIFYLTNLESVFRFFQILCVIPLFILVREEKFTYFFYITVFFAFLKCLMIIGVGVYLLTFGDVSIIRSWIHSIGGGDIYILGEVPKVQVHGNGLIPLIFILYTAKIQRLDFVGIVLLAGILFAGNFAFILGLLCYFITVIFNVIKKDTKNYKIVIIFFFIFIFFPFFTMYINKKVEEKSSYSNAIRIEQLYVLIDTNFFIGKGLGHQIYYQGDLRTYDGDNYFELQTVYIFNQIGIIGIILFYLVTIGGFSNTRYQKKRVLLYMIYLFYTFWNPYCFDTTQMITLVLLINTDLDFYVFQHRKKCITILNNYPTLKYLRY